jgi:hypothetical protein
MVLPTSSLLISIFFSTKSFLDHHKKFFSSGPWFGPGQNRAAKKPGLNVLLRRAASGKKNSGSKIGRFYRMCLDYNAKSFDFIDFLANDRYIADY